MIAAAIMSVAAGNAAAADTWTRLPDWDAAETCRVLLAPKKPDPLMTRICVGMETTAKTTLGVEGDLFTVERQDFCLDRIAKKAPASGISGSYVVLLRCLRAKDLPGAP